MWFRVQTQYGEKGVGKKKKAQLMFDGRQRIVQGGGHVQPISCV